MASRAPRGERQVGNRWAWAVFLVFAALAFAGVAVGIARLLDSAVLGGIGALFVFLPWTPILLPSSGTRARR